MRTRVPLLSITSLLLALGCGSSHDLDASVDSGFDTLEDASPDVLEDAADDTAPDVTPDVVEPPPARGLLYADLTCGLSDEQALTVAARVVACEGDDGSTTMTQAMELFHAHAWGGLFGGDVGGFTTNALDGDCTGWQCAVSATSCSELAACQSASTLDAFCAEEGEPGPRCNDDVLVFCPYEGGRGSAKNMIDCGRHGATCQYDERGFAACQIDECRFGAQYYDLDCDEERTSLQFCEGAVSLDCRTFGDDYECSSFAHGGEVPTAVCSPEGFGGAGAYRIPVECAPDGVVTFETVFNQTYEFDCTANGYSGCDEEGCTE